MNTVNLIGIKSNHTKASTQEASLVRLFTDDLDTPKFFVNRQSDGTVLLQTGKARYTLNPVRHNRYSGECNGIYVTFSHKKLVAKIEYSIK